MGRSNRKRPDSWSHKAREAGYAARSVYKLEEIERRFQVLRKTRRILDLGCAPGSWSQFVRKFRPNVKLVGIDIQEVESYQGTFLHQSILDTTSEAFLNEMRGAADLVLSDMAPNTSGDRFTDHLRQVELAEMALQTALGVLRQNGVFVAKVFDGEDAHQFVLSLSQHFGKVRRVKPAAVRNESVEFYVVCTGKKRAVHWSPPPREPVVVESPADQSSQGEGEAGMPEDPNPEGSDHSAAVVPVVDTPSSSDN